MITTRKIIVCMVILLVLCLIVPSTSAVSQGNEYESFNSELRGQLSEIYHQKKALTPAERKIDWSVIQIVRQVEERSLAMRGGESLRLQDLSTAMLKIDHDGKIELKLTLTDLTAEQIEQLEAVGMNIRLTLPEYGVVEGSLPYDRVKAVAGLDFVAHVGTPGYAIHNTGDVTSEGDTVLKAFDAREAFGVDGSGVKVGAISDGVIHLSESVASGDLPSSPAVQVLQAGTGDEGTAVLEIIHDLAPGSPLAFYGPTTSSDMVNGISSLESAGCNIIVDDVLFFDEPKFEDGPIAQEARAFCNDGGVYVTSAGNDAQGHYRSAYNRDGAVHVDSIVYYAHNYASSGEDIENNFNIPNGGSVRVVLQWNNRWGQAADDFDLFLVSGSTILGGSANVQDGVGGDDYPWEGFAYANDTGSAVTAFIAVLEYSLASAPSSLVLDYTVYPDFAVSLEYTEPENSVLGHAAVSEVLSVAAANWATPNTIEDFSSRGPGTVYFPTYEERQVPNITGVDRVQTKTGQLGYFANPFYGTSASAPHVAAIAALVWEADPTLTSSQVFEAITSTAVDLSPAAWDIHSGFGRADAYEAVASVVVPDIRTPIGDLDFEDLHVGSSLTMSTTIFNDGTATLTINSVTRTSGSEDFSYIGPSTPFDIGAGRSQDITVGFAPASLASKGATFNVNSNDPDEPVVTFTASGTGINSPPTQPVADVTPDSPTTGDDLTCTVTTESTDADGDTITYTYKWYKDDVLQPDETTVTTALTDTVSSALTSKGEVWRCEVTPNDGIEDGSSGQDQVTIGNSPPSVESVEITPHPAYTNTDLTAVPSGWDDADGDPEGYQYQWQKWTSSWQDIVGETSSTLDPANFVKGDQIKVICTPYDGIDIGSPVEDAITISNAPPTQPVVDVTPDSPVTTDALICSFTMPSTDPDEDPITYTYEWYKDTGAGFVLQPGLTTNTVDSSNTSRGEVWRCVVTPNDGFVDGPSDEDQVLVSNAPPTMPVVDVTPDSPLTGDDLTCNVTTPSTDPDGDTITYTYEWYKDTGAGFVLQPGLTTNTVDSSNTSEGEVWRCMVTPSDGTEDGPSGQDQVTIVITHDLTVGSTTGGSVTEPDEGTFTYIQGTVVDLLAEPDPGYAFVNWTGDVATVAAPYAADTTITMNGDYTITANFAEDNDSDGVADTEEQGPDGTDSSYDGNNDGDPDSQQDNVASLRTYDGEDYVTMASPDTTTMTDAQAVDNPSPADAPANWDFPYGFFDFTIDDVGAGGTTTVTLYLPEGASPTTYYKYGPTPGDPTSHWYEFLYDGQTGAEINGNTITLHFVDGQRGDNDLTADSTIVEPGGPGQPPEVAFSSATFNIAEDGGSVTITANLSPASTQIVRVDYATSDGTAVAGSDYTAASGKLTFNPGETSNTFDVTIVDDVLYEGDETVNLALSNPSNATLSTPNTAVLTINENDPPPGPSGGGGGGGGGGPPPRGPELEVDMMGRVASASVTDDGELEETIEVTSRDRKVRLCLDEGTVALDSDGNRLEEITVDRLSEWPEPPESTYVIGPAYDFGPDGARFDGSTELTICYDSEELPKGVNEEDIVIAYYHSDSGEWRLLERSVVDTGDHTVTASISHFTVFAIIGREAAAFDFANLSISPAMVDSGESVNISIGVTNSGGMQGSHTVTLLIDGVEEATQEVTLGPGASDTVILTVTRDDAGSYEATVDGLSDSFTVTEEGFAWWAVGLGIGLFLLIVAAGTAYMLIWRRRKATA